MLVKAQLATQIAEIIKRRRLTQSEAAEIVGLPQPKLSAMLRGQFRGISASKMLHCLTRLGRATSRSSSAPPPIPPAKAT
jgi:predicted XRE-type DNA-binding protein